MVGGEGGNPGEGRHVGPLEDGPLPAVGFAADNGDRADALECVDIEHHECKGGTKREDRGSVGMLLLAEDVRKCRRGAVGFRLAGVVDGGHGADEDLPGGEGADDADADLPVESEGLDQGFDEAPHGAGVALSHLV